MTFRKRSLILAVINLAAGMTLLLLSSWFIAASAMAGSVGVLAGFNYVVPAALIRFLAIVRIASGYFDKYAGHLHLLNQLHAIRRQTLKAVFQKNNSVRQSETGQTLEQATEQLASAWAATYNPALSSVVIVGAFSILFAMLWPALLPLWIGYLALVLLVWAIYFIAYNRSIETEHHKLKSFLNSQQQWLKRHTLWPLTPQEKTINHLQQQATLALHARLTHNKLGAYFEHLLLLLSLGVILLIPLMNQSNTRHSALFVLPFFIFISVKDWLLPMLNGINQGALRRHQAQTLTGAISAKYQKTKPDMAMHQPTQQVQSIGLDAFCWQRLNHQGISLTAEFKKPGVYLFEGATGLGKSSTFEALSGELPYQGRLIVNGVDLDKNHSEDRRRLFHHAQQFGHIFSDSLYQNLLIANPSAGTQEIQNALIWAELSQWIDEDGLNRWLGPQGIPISGGEQKRLLLARAYLANAPVWLLDEPFEGLDKTTVDALVEKMNAMAQHRIIIIASHIFPTALKTTDTLKIS